MSKIEFGFYQPHFFMLVRMMAAIYPNIKGVEHHAQKSQRPDRP